jgi:hypothetical protein
VNALNCLNNKEINGKQLLVKFYESKNQKQQMMEDFMDKKDFSKYKHQEMFEEYAMRP